MVVTSRETLEGAGRQIARPRDVDGDVVIVVEVDVDVDVDAKLDVELDVDVVVEVVVDVRRQSDTLRETWIAGDEIDI